jgi:hypothetical protein
MSNNNNGNKYNKIGNLGEKIIESGILDQLKLKDSPTKKKWNKNKKKKEQPK